MQNSYNLMRPRGPRFHDPSSYGSTSSAFFDLSEKCWAP